MASLLDLHPCPHCGKEMHAGAMTRHAPMCFKNPAVYTRCRAALTSPTDSARGITLTQYKGLHAVDGSLPARTTLLQMTGAGPWNDVLAAFGLLPPNEKKQCPHCGKEYVYSSLPEHIAACRAAQPRVAREPKAAPPAKPPKPAKAATPRKLRTAPQPTTCPQCGAQRIKMERHVCPEDPAVVTWLAEHLPDPLNRECIISSFAYLRLSDAPISRNAVSAAYGDWNGLAARYGLKPHKYQPTGAPSLDPTSHTELHRLADLLHGGEFGPSYSEYIMYGENTTLKAAGLEKRFGTWAAVLGAAGLRHGSRSEYHLAANARRRAHQRNQNDRRGFDRGDEPINREHTGIPVLPNPRQLASGGVAWTVR